VLLSSDAIRENLSNTARRSGERVFSAMHEQFEMALAQGAAVVLDSTGMSPRFRALLRAHRMQLLHVHLLLHDPQRFEEREHARTDRQEAPVARAAFHRSRRIEFHDPPDLTIATDELDVQQVYDIVSCAIGGGTG
jgi:predicted kinase